MSYIDQVSLSSFRNFDVAKFNFKAGLNLISGRNGSGKTSILEALYVMAYGRSFRASILSNLIMSDAREAAIFIQSGSDDFGWSRSNRGEVKYHHNKKSKSAAELVNCFPPCLFIDSSSHRVFGKQSIYRRQLLDWGVYHSCSDFGSTWNIYQRALKQRNAAIKSKRPLAEITQWDGILVTEAEKIKAMRADYMESLKSFFQKSVSLLVVSSMDPQLRISHGWSGNFDESLKDCINDDLRYGYTTIGPHRGKIDILINGVVAKDGASEGQQKLLHYALRLAQAQYLYDLNEKKVVFLIDDIGAELDEVNQMALINKYLSLGSQLIITNIIKPAWHDLVEKEHILD